MAAPPESLLRYCPPVLVSRRGDRASAAVSGAGGLAGAAAGGRGCRGAPAALTALPSRVPAESGPAQPRRLLLHAAAAGAPERHPAAAVSGAGPGPAVPAGRPVAPWEEAQKLWVQEVSTAPSTRRDVLQLQEQLDRQLQQRQARETGLCPVRRELYTQCFDELIRQTTVSCAERGLLLLRVRDELRLTLSAYQALYESSVAFGVRKALLAEQGKAHLEKR
ncbi:hypothetical protein DV515_00019065, partial [Chloebia gouldiae]